MKASIVPIGNSKGLRIPKTLLEQCKITDEVLIEVKGDAILIKPVKRKPRKSWKRALQKMHERNEDALILSDSLDIYAVDWEW